MESSQGMLREELLDREAFDTLKESQVLVERWRRYYNTVRPHSSLGYRPPAPEAVMPWSDQQALLFRQAAVTIECAAGLT